MKKNKIILATLIILCLSAQSLALSSVSTTSEGDFSAAASRTQVSLSIWDDTDYSTKYTNENIMFYANYSNGTIGDYADCEINFDLGAGYGSWQNMTYDPLSGLYIFSTGFSTEDVFYFSVKCGMSECSRECCSCLQTEDDFYVIAGQPSPVPEFSLLGLAIMLVIIGLEVFVLFRKKR